MNLQSLIEKSKPYINVVKDLESSEAEYTEAVLELEKLLLSLRELSSYTISKNINIIPYYFLEKLLDSDLLTSAAKKRVIKRVHPDRRKPDKVEECPVCWEVNYIQMIGCRHWLCNSCLAKIKVGNEVKCPLCRSTSILR